MSRVEEVANEFSRVLQEWLNLHEMELVRIRNATETDPNICHSHDVCDANMAMLEAFENLGFTSPCDLEDGDPKNDEVHELWAEAWDLAKKNQFQVQ